MVRDTQTTADMMYPGGAVAIIHKINQEITQENTYRNTTMQNNTPTEFAVLSENLLRRTQAAVIISQALKYEPSLSESPESMIENAIASMSHMTPAQQEIVDEMLHLAESAGIILEGSAEESDDESDEFDDLQDEEIDDLISGLSDEDLLHAYDDDEFGVYDQETGERIEEELDEQFSEPLNEVLSRMERIKSRLRMAKNKTKMKSKLKIALHKKQSPETLQRRARRLAVKTLTQKIAKKPISMMSTSEKERVERIVSRRKQALSRIAMKLVPHVRQVEKDRLSR